MEKRMNKRTKFGILGIIILTLIFIVIVVYLFPHKDIIPPPASLKINGIEQTSGIGSYCWFETWKGLCADYSGIPTPDEPLPAISPFTVHLSLPLKEPPQELEINVIPVTEDDKIKSYQNGSFMWHPEGEKMQEGNYSRLAPERESDINLSLEPGLYVLHVRPIWTEKGSVSYGFLLAVQ
jgi:hypothetical protein